jgi:hypothetical protein
MGMVEMEKSVPELRKKVNGLISTALILGVTGLFSFAFLRQKILPIFLLGSAASLGIVTITIILKNKGAKAGLTRAIVWTVLLSFLFIFLVRFYHASAFPAAIENGDIDKIRKFISKGYDVNGRIEGGQNVLTFTFWYGAQRVHPFTDTRKSDLMTPEEIETKVLEMLEILIDNGADINVRDPHGWAPIHKAAERGQKEIAKMLIGKGADVNLINRDGGSPLHFAAEHADNSEMIELLIANGADVNVEDVRGDTPLHNSVYSGSMEIVETLIKNGAEVNPKNKEGKTPLALAVEQGKTEIAEFLRQNGATE